MSNKLGDWWNQAWNPVTGCTPCSPACDNCWAQSFLKRFKQIHGNNDPRKIILHENRLEAPLHWTKPRRVFVCNLSDLFHEEVPDGFIHSVFWFMSKCPQHTFYILTKRPERLAKCWDYISRALEKDVSPGKKWFGVTAWDQDSVNNAIGPLIIDNPGYNTFLSLEPLLGPITLQTFGEYLEEWLPNWIIVGGETGPKARPMQSEWVRSIRDQCVEAGVPFWFKSWGAWIPDVKPGDDPHMLKYLLDGQTWHQRPEEV